MFRLAMFPADTDVTKKGVEAGNPVGVRAHDHLAVGRQGVASFKSLRLI